jgi:hypothetical protein
MTTCRTLDEVYAAAAADSIGEPPLTQAQADLVAVILAPYGDQITATPSTSGRPV